MENNKLLRVVAKCSDEHLGDLIVFCEADDEANANTMAELQKKDPILNHLGVFKIEPIDSCNHYKYRGFEIFVHHNPNKRFLELRGMFEYIYNIVDCRCSEPVHCGHTYGTIHDACLCIDRIAEGLGDYLIKQ